MTTHSSVLAPQGQKLVLAYSGGLDTSVILHWLTAQGYEVVALCVDVGQPRADLEGVVEKGIASGAKEVLIHDVREDFVREFVFPAVSFNALYEGTYPLGTALARPIIARQQVLTAQEHGATTLSHGATGKGNDQVRFELGYHALNPALQVIAPWKTPAFFEKLPGRRELISYAEAHRLPIKATLESPWSSDENLMHISFESGMLENPWQEPLERMFEYSQHPSKGPNIPQTLTITYEAGIPVALDGEAFTPASLLKRLNAIGGEHGIGRIDIVESRFVGMKSRGVYETPGGTILHIANRAIESITLDRGVISLKDSLMPRFADLVYNGMWFSAEMRALLTMLQQTQAPVHGDVRLSLYKGTCQVTGRRSPFSLYDENIASMEDDHGAYQPADAIGFIRLNALPLKMAYHQQKRMETARKMKP